MALLIGTAGVPISTKVHSTVAGIKRVRELGLDALEIEFVRGVNMSANLAEEVKAVAKKNNVVLTVHAPYYINLNSAEKPKIYASMNRILKSAEIGNIAGAISVAFHPAYYGHSTPKQVYKIVKRCLNEMTNKLKQNKNKIMLALETTGKKSQFGSLSEVLSLSAEIQQIQPCIDFAHLHARENGKLNSRAEFDKLFEQIENALGKKALQQLHMHISGIEYSESGERRHLVLQKSDFKIDELIASLKHYNISGVMICESPNIEFDALFIKNKLSLSHR